MTRARVSVSFMPHDLAALAHAVAREIELVEASLRRAAADAAARDPELLDGARAYLAQMLRCRRSIAVSMQRYIRGAPKRRRRRVVRRKTVSMDDPQFDEKVAAVLRGGGRVVWKGSISGADLLRTDAETRVDEAPAKDGAAP